MSLSAYLGIGLMLILALVFGLGSRAVSAWLADRDPTPEKLDPYECGIVPEQEPAERFPVQFYLVAMVFIAFDIEIIFLYPWAVIMHGLQFFGLAEMLVFVVIVFIAYGYILREGVFDWAPRSHIDRSELMRRYYAEAAQIRESAAAAVPGGGGDTEAA